MESIGKTLVTFLRLLIGRSDEAVEVDVSVKAGDVFRLCVTDSPPASGRVEL